jgi:hypothetical protein
MATFGWLWIAISASLVVMGIAIASIGKGSIKKHVHRKKNQAGRNGGPQGQPGRQRYRPAGGNVG